MRVTEPIRQHLLKTLHDRGISQSAFAKEIGHHKTWASRLLRSGPSSIKRLDEDDKDRIETFLGILLETFEDTGKRVPQMALDVAEALKCRPDLATVIAPLMKLAEPDVQFAIPHFDNKALVKLGAEATKIVARWDENGDPHYTKIGLEILVLVRELVEAEVA